MARIAGIDIPPKKRMEVALTYIHGIGTTSSRLILDRVGVSFGAVVDDLTDEQVSSIRELIESQFKVEGDLRRDVASNIKRLKDIQAYRGIRHIRKLPVRGQRTHTNARTRKGRAIAIAGKKKVTK